MQTKEYKIKKGTYYIGDLSNFINDKYNLDFESFYEKFWIKEPIDIIVEEKIESYNFIMFMEIDGNNQLDFATDSSVLMIINENNLNNEVFNDPKILTGVAKFTVKKDATLYKSDNELYYKDGLFKKYLVKK